ncbi:MAG: RNA methyltransferase [Acidimicrobiales bacterium]
MLTTPVTDPDDPRIAAFVGLRDHELRKRREQPGGDMAGVFICEGDLVVERALRAGYQLTAILIDAKRTAPFPFAADDTVTVFAAAPAVLLRITGYALHRGMLACFVRRPELEASTVLDNARRIIVLEGVNNPTNLGIIARSAAALGIDAMLLDDFCCDPLYRRASRVAMGEVFKLPYARLGPFPEGLALLHQRGFELVALTPEPGALPIDRLQLDDDTRVALLFGAEGPGLTDTTLAHCEHHVRIPMRDGVDSLNIAAAAAIAIWCVSR